MKCCQLTLSVLLIALPLTSCSTMPGQSDGIDEAVDTTIGKFCPLASPSPEDRIKRAEILLAAIAGYGYRSVQNHSRLSEVKDDANRIVDRLNEAYTQIGIARQQLKSGLFPVYRADMIVELSEAAGAAISPTLRAAKRSIVATSTGDRLTTAKNALVGLLEDDIYRSAYQQACLRLSEISDDDLILRITARCDALSTMAGAGAMKCTMQ